MAPWGNQMRNFRFPRLTILLMIACFLAISGAIGLAEETAWKVLHPTGSPGVFGRLWKQLPALFETGFLVVCLFGAIGYGALMIFGRTGGQRLSDLDAHPSKEHR